jgi:hypothetical protein
MANSSGDSSVTDKKQTVADRIADLFVRQTRQLLLASLASLTWFAVCSPAQTSGLTGSVQPKTAWSKDYKHLVEIHQIKTKQGKNGDLIVERYLTDKGKTLVIDLTVQLNTKPDKTSARQLWRKQV